MVRGGKAEAHVPRSDISFGPNPKSKKRVDAAQVSSNVGLAHVDGQLECSVANAAKQILSERWRVGGGRGKLREHMPRGGGS